MLLEDQLSWELVWMNGTKKIVNHRFLSSKEQKCHSITVLKVHWWFSCISASFVQYFMSVIGSCNYHTWICWSIFICLWRLVIAFKSGEKDLCEKSGWNWLIRNYMKTNFTDHKFCSYPSPWWFCIFLVPRTETNKRKRQEGALTKGRRTKARHGREGRDKQWAICFNHIVLLSR